MAGWGVTDPISSWNSVFVCRDPAKGLGIPANREHYCNAKADSTMSRAASIFDPKFRIQAEREGYSVALRHDFAYVPLYWEDVIAGVNNHVGWESRPPDEFILAWAMTRK